MPTHTHHRSRTCFLTAIGIFTCAAAVHGQIVNPSFEDVYSSPRDPYYKLPSGWNIFVDEDSGYDTSWADQCGDIAPFGPTDGQMLAIVSTPLPLWQTVTLTAGDTILVDVAFATNLSHAVGAAVIALGSSSTPWNYAASSSINVPWESNFGWAFSKWWCDWQTLSLTVPATGTYDLLLIGSFGGNADGGTHTYFDNIRVIPVPGATALLAISGIHLLRRRR